MLSPRAIRLCLLVVGAYGLRLSRTASQNIDATARRAAAGDEAAQAHFTQTRDAHVLGPKNSDLGLLYYGAIAVASVTNLTSHRAVTSALRLGSFASLTMSAYLLFALVRRRTWCPICMQGHALNVITWWLLRRPRDQRG
jgi:hypothetical protein